MDHEQLSSQNNKLSHNAEKSLLTYSYTLPIIVSILFTVCITSLITWGYMRDKVKKAEQEVKILQETVQTRKSVSSITNAKSESAVTQSRDNSFTGWDAQTNSVITKKNDATYQDPYIPVLRFTYDKSKWEVKRISDAKASPPFTQIVITSIENCASGDLGTHCKGGIGYITYGKNLNCDTLICIPDLDQERITDNELTSRRDFTNNILKIYRGGGDAEFVYYVNSDKNKLPVFSVKNNSGENRTLFISGVNFDGDEFVKQLKLE